MKKAFTIMELVLVIVVVGILAAVITPRRYDTSIQEAIDQVLRHIRYTQHLAIIDDKYNDGDDDWYKGRWQIIFHKVSNNKSSKKPGDHIGYSVFSDLPAYTGNPDPAEVALNPEDPKKILTAGFTGMAYNKASNTEITKNLDLTDTYHISDVEFSASCSINGSRRISFDEQGRPYRGDLRNATLNANTLDANNYAVYHTMQNEITDVCVITLRGRGVGNILIYPETGFACADLFGVNFQGGPDLICDNLQN